MEYLHNKNLKSNSQNLRKNMTKEERRLWYEFLKTLPVTFNRQKIINNYKDKNLFRSRVLEFKTNIK